MLEKIKEEQYKKLPFESYMKGFPFKESIADALTSHRFEATYMRRVLGILPDSVNRAHELIFRDFLSYAFDNPGIVMDWRTGLYFLKWAYENGKLEKIIKTTEEIALRSLSRWVNATQMDIDFSGVILRSWPGSGECFWLMGEKSLNPFEKPKIYRIKPFEDLCMAPRIAYKILPKNNKTYSANWLIVE